MISGKPSYQNAASAATPRANATGKPMITNNANRPNSSNKPKAKVPYAFVPCPVPEHLESALDAVNGQERTAKLIRR